MPFSDGCLWLDMLPVRDRETGIRVVLTAVDIGESDRIGVSGWGYDALLVSGGSNGNGCEMVRVLLWEPGRGGMLVGVSDALAC